MEKGRIYLTEFVNVITSTLLYTVTQCHFWVGYIFQERKRQIAFEERISYGSSKAVVAN